MRLRPAFLGLGLAFLAATAARSEEVDLLANAASCRQAADRPICLLRVVAALNPSRLAQDIELRAHPALLAAAGVHLDQPPPAPAYEDSDVLGANAAEMVMTRLAAGDTPADALARLDQPSLIVKHAQVSIRPTRTSPRLIAYRRLWALSRAGAPYVETPGFRAELLSHWEAALRDGDDPDALSDATALAAAYRLAGDEHDVTRAIALPPAPSDRERLERLLAAHRLKEAVQISAQASTAGDEEALRSFYEANVAAANRQFGEYQTQLRARAEALVAQWRKEGRTKDADELERGLAKALPDGAPTPDERARAEIPLDAWASLTDARSQLVKALLKEGDLATAREVADQLLQAPMRSLLGGFWNSDVVLKAATPTAAVAWLERAEHALDAGDIDKEKISSAAELVLGGWAAVGQTSRADRLWRGWMPVARREIAEQNGGGYEGTPHADAIRRFLLAQDQANENAELFKGQSPQLLYNDILHGRGDRVGGYLDRAADGDERMQLIGQCVVAAGFVVAVDVAAQCLERGFREPRTVTTSYTLRALAISSAAVAAQNGHLDAALAAYDKALLADRQLPAGSISDNSTVLPTLQEIAKAELRADGRLPPVGPEDDL